MELSDKELERYDRQIRIPGWGVEGQLKVKNSKVVVTGCGGLGSPASIYLAAAGVGHLVIIDKEKFELSNLNRQILGWEKDLGRPKVEAAVEKLRQLNPEIKVEGLCIELTEENVEELIEGATVVVDAMDNWRTRFILNEACVKKRIPMIHAGVMGLGGQLTTIIPGETPCLNCIFSQIPEIAGGFPVLGTTPGVLAILQVFEALKLITGVGKLLTNKILVFDGETLSFDVVEVKRNPECKVCKDV
ncbi:MAG: HesA/MoeB/ThiF family protein [Candidatus Odinarchaeia archaeon]